MTLEHADPTAEWFGDSTGILGLDYSLEIACFRFGDFIHHLYIVACQDANTSSPAVVDMLQLKDSTAQNDLNQV